MDVWASVTIWTGDTLSAPLANNQAISKFELNVTTDYEMLLKNLYMCVCIPSFKCPSRVTRPRHSLLVTSSELTSGGIH